MPDGWTAASQNGLIGNMFRAQFAPAFDPGWGEGILGLNNALMGHQLGVDVPLPGGGYVNQGSIGAATVNHLAQSATPPVAQATFRPRSVFKPPTDPRNKSGVFGSAIGTIIEIGGTAGLGAITGRAALAAEGAPQAVGMAGRTGQTFEILDGVRRAKAAAELGQTTIEAQVQVGGKIVQTGRVPIDALRSPFKSALDVSTPTLMQRWLRVLQGARAGDALPPIVIQPGASGTPIQQLPFIF